MLRFIIGTNEKARRERLYSEIKSAGAPSYLIVPEQFSFESEKLLGDFLGPEGAQRVEVLSFSRLCNSVFRAFGGIAGEYSDDTTKLLLMGAALSGCAENLKYYKKSARGAPFVKKLVETDAELKNAGITPSDLLSLAENAPEGALSDKALDLAAVFTLYDALLEKSWLDPLTDISRACDMLAERDFFSEKNVYIDNFTGFTGSEYKLLRIILEQSPFVTVSLCCPDIYDRTGGSGLFSKTQRTASRLENMARAAAARVAPPILALPETDSRPGALIDLEENFLQPGGSPERGNDGAVRLVAAADPYDEANFVACEARLLAEGGMRWREMAVIARDLSQYSHALPAAFERAGIPLYMDKPAELSSHPLAAFVTASLSAVRGGFDPGDVMRILKTGILPVSAEDAAEFENYCFIWNIRGRLFLSDFTGSPRGFSEMTPEDIAPLERINSVRRALCNPLGRLKSRLSGADGAEFSAALFDYMTECKVTDGLRRLYDSFAAEGDLAFAEELDSFWSYLISLLDKFSAALRGVRLGDESTSRLFELALMSAKIGTLPQTLDCVSAGTADRIRPGAPKAVFIIGAADGVFPARPVSGGLFTESERREMSALGLDLGEGENDALLSERMYAFTAFTAPSEKLFVSYPKYDCAFGEQSPSVLVRRLSDAVAPLSVLKTSDLPESFWLCCENFAFERLAAFGGSSTPASEALKNYFLSRPIWREKAEKLGGAVLPESFVLKERENAERLFGSKLFLSPTKIETYESCPFSYFLKYGLSLKERQKAELSPLSAGSLIHSVLQQIVSVHGGAGLGTLSDSALRAEIDSVLKDYMDSVFGSEKDKTSRFMYLYKRMAGFLFRLLRRLGEEFRLSEFEPYAFELPVGGEGEVSAYRLLTPGGKEITVEGKIDRVDVLNRDGKRWVRVVDYKSGSKKFELCDVFYGINIQMLVYLFSIQSGGRGGLANALPAGVLYMPARDSVITMPRGDIAEGGKAALGETFRMNGLLIDDKAVLNAMEPGLGGVFIPAKETKNGPSGSLATLAQLGEIKEHVDSLLIEMAKELGGGKIAALPYKKGNDLSCDRCSFRSVCRRGEDSPFVLHEKFKDDEFYRMAKGGRPCGE